MAATSFSTGLAYPPKFVTISAVSENECEPIRVQTFCLNNGNEFP